MEDHHDAEFSTMEELCKDQTSMLSYLDGQSLVQSLIGSELTKLWKEEAKKGRTPDELAR